MSLCECEDVKEGIKGETSHKNTVGPLFLAI